MKSIYAFAFFVSILCIGVFPVSSDGADTIDFSIGKTPYRISLAAEAGVLLGQVEEIVYADSNTDTYLSQLLWDLKPLVYLGSGLSFSRANPLDGLGGTADLSVKFGLPIRSGTLENRDWQNKADPDMVTDFSSHDLSIQGGEQVTMLLDFSGGISIPIKSAVALRALLSFSYMHFSWSGQGGYGRYMARDPYSTRFFPEAEWRRRTFQGTVITYEQVWIIPSPGLGVLWPVHRVLDLDFRFFMSPLIFVWDLDIHMERKLRFYDTMSGGLYLEPGVDISFTPNPFLTLLLHGSWRYSTGTRGKTIMTSTGSTTIIGESYDTAGVGYSAFDVGLSLRVALPLGLLSKR
ncbi:hypothetical protein AGMMS49942_14900 [Spirochaetia bacterium]|nr:hypothetical protein AGMMS49942_14900 [Spirochaetia bacterium]